ncbi:hypothetical protein BX616_006302 [Lobosporangium transversale]|uniref:FAD-binding domain-containing protein n=1 Tax=Lobosporangium transversale TaxID=64571 RepID=A0A1Y2G5Y1_9FUNG|nr:hypothetical protein BCR41DRAFT_390722 [Lobosporangium transversale]KAF9915370.1 hypothetical protein BX616_006302 [Lobosporangium transversale]ORY96062.1 hypothetical protein BCR41DRAFT_390722 [Lobosporangium transversale]|eukprot:XP_021875489.1 hypothetical protein BCR41DRAFT_390722 [Lobosporangium transversale]
MIADSPQIKRTDNPSILIVGAGIGGLTLAILLEKAGVQYEIFDRMAEIKPLGSALMLGSNVTPLFKQLGIYDEFISLARVVYSVDTLNEEREIEVPMPLAPIVEMGGHKNYIVTRSVLYDLLRRQIPAQKVHLGKRVLSFTQDEYGVELQFSDGSVALGDVLVGADGAYSAVRQSLYKELKKEGKLPSSDDGSLPFSCVCLVGQTKPLDPIQYPRLNKEYCEFNYVIGKDKPYSWATWTTRGNIYCWSVTLYLNKESSKDNDSFRNSEWGPEAATAMSKDVRDFPAVGEYLDNGLTIGNLIDNTPLVSKVMLEEKVFGTWYHERTVLLGDACHKVHPASGSGAVNAIHDAVALANWLSVLNSNKVVHIERIFKEYRAERYPAALAAFASGQTLSKLRASGWKAAIARFIVRNLPLWLYKIMLKNLVAHRPQVSFLPLVDDSKGTLAAKHQPSLEKTLAIHKKLEEKKASTPSVKTTSASAAVAAATAI